MVLAAVAELGERGADPSNRQIANAAGIVDQGQTSRLLARLKGYGLLENTGGDAQGVPKAWHLTDKGLQITQTFRAHAHNHREVAS
jgi:DNA-binding MarR family transcriptional regulator